MGPKELAHKLWKKFRLAYYDAWESEKENMNAEHTVDYLAGTIKLARKAENIRVNSLDDDYAYNKNRRYKAREKVSQRLNRIHQAITEGGKPQDHE